LDFYIRRAFRLYPLAVLTILLAAGTHAPVAGLAYHYFHAASFSAMGLLVNCLLLEDLIGLHPIIHGVTWSLSPEVYMYILLPGLFVYARFVRRRWPLVFIWLLAVLFARHVFLLDVVGNIFPTLIPDFLCGIIAYVGFMRAKPVLPSWTFLPILMGLFLVYISHHDHRTDWIVCLALGLVLPYIKQFEWRPGEWAAQTLATYSYGIYLFHPFSIVLGMYLLRGKPLALQLAVELSSLAVASFLGYHALEFPMIKLGARVAAKFARERGLPSETSLETLEPAP
jgi:peptidoglycan/LPS O-acetylase OafA/YrhL